MVFRSRNTFNGACTINTGNSSGNNRSNYNLDCSFRRSACFGTNHDFSSWGKYANYIFLGVLGISLIGSFSGPFILVAFFLALIGFIVYLIHQIYMTKIRPSTPFLNGIGLYTAYMGVFVEILQLVIRMLADER